MKRSVKRRPLRFETVEHRRMMAVLLAPLESASSDQLWQSLNELPAQPNATSYIRAQEIGAFQLDLVGMTQKLAEAPREWSQAASASPKVISIPNPVGAYQQFQIFESLVMSPALSAKFPTIRTYAGQGITDPSATVRLDVTPQGFHAQVLSPRGGYYVDPYYHLHTQVYASYFTSGLYSTNGLESVDGHDVVEFSEGNDPHYGTSPILPPATNPPLAPSSPLGRSGTELRIYRAAVAATGEYTAFHGGTANSGMAAVVTAMNRVTGIYENELSIRMVLVDNNDQLIYTDGNTDPYSNNNAGALLGENQTNLDNVIGDANYDIGHVFTTGGGGLAGLGVVGISRRKAMGETGLPTPIGDPFYVDYVAHEIGHQYGGNHTFNSTTGACAGGNRNARTAYEIGSGSTIQAYAGICGSDDLQPNSDPQFHTVSFDEILQHVDVAIPSVGVRQPTGNTVPTVSAGKDYTIPARTPFILTATGVDSDSSDVLSFDWQQRDLGPTTSLSDPDNGSSPLFRVWPPTVSPSRSFPRLSDLVRNQLAKGEVMPSTNRTMAFRVVARDNRTGGGGVNTDDMQVTVVDTGAAFAISAPNTAVSWEGFTTQTITWAVAGTTANGIDTANVDISLSTDGGLTYPIVLARSVANDGSQDVVIPNRVGTTNRIRIQGTDHIFFDISDVNFTITPAPATDDFGDAPDVPYGTLLASGGASHRATGLLLGATLDVESDGLPSVGADGDGLDEDGVRFSEPIVAGTMSFVEVTSSGPGVLDYFVDFDKSGGFGNQPNEVFRFDLTGGTQRVPITVPVMNGTQTYARFRLSTAGGLGPKGSATDGEVEDYIVDISPPPPTIRVDVGLAVFRENSAAIIISPAASVIDPYRTSYPDSTFTIGIVQGGEGPDRLDLKNEGDGPNQIGVGTTTIRFGGTPVAAWQKTDQKLELVFNANSSPEAVQAVMRRVTFVNPSEAPLPLLRSVEYRLQGSFGTIKTTRLVNVIPVNDPPAVGPVTIPTVNEDSLSPQGSLVLDLFDRSFNDPDTSSFQKGIAVVENEAKIEDGSWQFSTDFGNTWVPIGSVDDTNLSLVLSSQSMVGFLPSPNFFGTPSPLQVRAIDDTYSGRFSSSVVNSREFLPLDSRTPDGPASLASTPINVRVANINDAPRPTVPELIIQGTQGVYLEQTLSNSLFDDIDSPVLTWSIESFLHAVPGWIEFDSESRTIRGTPQNQDVGNYVLYLSVTDNFGDKASIALTLQVANVNDPPEQFSITSTSVNENSPEAKIGDISIVDPDPNDQLRWLSSDARFEVRDGGLFLVRGAILDFETEQTIPLTLIARDSGTPPLSLTIPLDLKVNDLNEFFPDLQSQKIVVEPSHVVGTMLTDLEAPDGDSFQSTTFTLTGGEASNFAIDPSTGQLRFASHVVLDYAKKPEYRLLVQATDNGVPAKARTALMTVQLAPINLNAPEVTTTTLTVLENAAANTSLGRVQTRDSDGNLIAGFAILAGPSSGLFSIDSATGEITVVRNAPLNFETQPTHQIVVEVTDDGLPSKTGVGTITIQVQNINDPPTRLTLEDPVVAVNQEGFLIGRIQVTDEDPASSYAFQFSDPRFTATSDGRLALKSTTSLPTNLAGASIDLQVTVSDASDVQSRSTLPLRLQVVANPSPWQNRKNRLDVDRDGLITPSDVLIVVNDLNLRLPRQLSSPRTFDELVFLDIDTDGDLFATPQDALLVVNALNLNSGGEGEPDQSHRAIEISSRAPATVSEATDLWLAAFRSLDEELTQRRYRSR